MCVNTTDNGRKNQLSKYFSSLLMPQHFSIALNNAIHRFNMSLSQSFFQHDEVTNVVRKGTGYPSNRPHTGVTFPLVAYWMAKCIITLVMN